MELQSDSHIRTERHLLSVLFEVHFFEHTENVYDQMYLFFFTILLFIYISPSRLRLSSLL